MSRVGRAHVETLSETGTIILGEAAPGRVCRWLVQFTVSDTATVQPQGRSAQPGAPAATNLAFYDLATGAMATEAPTASGIILVDGTGMLVELDVTITGGTVAVYATPVIG